MRGPTGPETLVCKYFCPHWHVLAIVHLKLDNMNQCWSGWGQWDKLSESRSIDVAAGLSIHLWVIGKQTF